MNPSSSIRPVHAWLMVLPALLVLLAFTHWPAVATLVDSFFSTPRGGWPAQWVGLENYQVMAEDPVFWKAATNNLLYAAVTIPAIMPPTTTGTAIASKSGLSSSISSASLPWPAITWASS